MWKDEIVEETRRQREAYAAKFSYDLEAIYQDLKKKELEGKRRTVALPRREPASPMTQRPAKPSAP
jgi:hypothetical protein